MPNKSLKQTVKRVTLFAAKATPASRYGSLVPSFGAKALLNVFYDGFLAIHGTKNL
jgi:hypothetical protein